MCCKSTTRESTLYYYRNVLSYVWTKELIGGLFVFKDHNMGEYLIFSYRNVLSYVWTKELIVQPSQWTTADKDTLFLSTLLL